MLRNIFQTLCIFSLVLLLCLQTSANQKKNHNILMIIVDDLRTQLGCYGHKRRCLRKLIGLHPKEHFSKQLMCRFLYVERLVQV